MSQEHPEHLNERLTFSGFGLGLASGSPETGVFILAVYRDGSLSAAAYATEQGAMEAALASLDDEREPGDEGGGLEDHYARAQAFIADEGGTMEIIPSPLYGG